MTRTIIALVYAWGFAVLIGSAWLSVAAVIPCPTEDSDNCYWDAQTRGDGLGHSFITVAGFTILWG